LLLHTPPPSAAALQLQHAPPPLAVAVQDGEQGTSVLVLKDDTSYGKQVAKHSTCEVP
jgi:hypothetical protein